MIAMLSPYMPVGIYGALAGQREFFRVKAK
jgi:hypothetical protein